MVFEDGISVEAGSTTASLQGALYEARLCLEPLATLATSSTRSRERCTVD